jgi:hypothetical protein
MMHKIDSCPDSVGRNVNRSSSISLDYPGATKFAAKGAPVLYTFSINVLH